MVDQACLIDLLIDLWRIRRRAQRDAATPSSVRVACEVAMDRVAALGYRIEELVGQPYDPGMRVRVVEHEGGPANPRISECLCPAVYRGEDQLVRQAEVIVQGE
jgi:hypothetical protein